MRALISGLCLSLALAGAALAQDPSDTTARLHDDLRLTSEQEGAWRQYQTAVAAGAQMQARHASAERLMPQLPTPRRLALQDATMAQDLSDFRQMGVAVAAFYAKLTPDQQRAFDRDTLPSSDAPR